MSVNEKIKVLLIEDDATDQMAMSKSMERLKHSYAFEAAGSIAEGRDALENRSFDIVITDYKLPDGNALDIVKTFTNLPFILITGAGCEEVAVQAMKLGVYEYLIKDQDRNYLNTLETAIESAIYHHSLKKERDQIGLELEKSRQEFQEFSYIISHDLKAPLRGIQSLADWISGDYADKLGPEGKEQLNLLIDRVHRLHMLLDGVLRYSRSQRIRDERRDLDLNTFMKELMAELKLPENVSLQYPSQMPVVHIEPERLKMIFLNLIQNASESYEGKPGSIFIQPKKISDTWQFTFEDKGKGISPEAMGSIFKVFYTHSSDENSSHAGMGLAIVKKLVEGCGGTIHAESVLGQGSKFIFTVPALRA